MPIAPGARFDHYDIITPLGKGGMGEVYLAEDTRLKRKVALKFLPSEFTQSFDRLRRFEQEAQATSALNHPNIITIFEVGAANGNHFITTEFIDGETLRQKLEHEKLSVKTALEIATQAANALAAAHEAGIVHRDIKPENMMLRRDGFVKVLDFGLAKLMERSGETTTERRGEDDPTLALSPDRRVPSHSTEIGVVMGTASYMSPEQARGQKVDARTDIFSLGVVLYEMISGTRPFDGVNMLDIVAGILDREPKPLTEAPPELQRIVSKSLQKDREQRYQSAKDLQLDLQSLKDKLTFEATLGAQTLGAQAASLPSERSEAIDVASGSADEPIISSPEQRAARRALAAGEPPALRRLRTPLVIALAALALVLVAIASFFYFKHAPTLTDKDTILLADFTNTTGDSVFDGTLKQALAVHLGQSPFLNLFADERVRETLRLMNRSPDERVTPTVGREICQRQGLKAMLTGTIASLGRNYVLNLEAVNAQTGDVLAREQAEAEGKEQVLRSLGEAATRLREKLGESLSSIQKFDVPLAQATTSSLDALKAYSLGAEQDAKGKHFEAIASLKHAIELDSNLALAYTVLASAYFNSNQPGLAAEAAQKAFELRERVSEREKFNITAYYYSRTTGELHKAIEAIELWKQTYPNDAPAHGYLGSRYTQIGQHERATEELREAIRLNPNAIFPYENLSTIFLRLNHFEEAKAIGEQSFAQQLNSVVIHGNFYNIAFIHRDAAAMQQQVDWANRQPGEYAHLNWQAGAAAFAGQWQQARELSNRAAELAGQRNLQEVAGDIVSSNAEVAAVLGQCEQSRAELARAAALPRTPLSYFRAGIALALCGATAQANTLTDEAVKRYHPKHTLVNEVYLPLIRAALELQRGNRTQAIQLLQPARRYESVSFFYQNYLRGQAYLGEGKGAEAAAEFQTILDHRGWSPASSLYPLAQLGLARAAMLQGDTAKAKQSYEMFLQLWKDADADLPILLEAKKEYEKLK